MKNIHILPTDKPSRLQLTKNNKLFYSEFEKSYSDCSNQNIYITNDEEIKYGDWFIHNSHNTTSLHKAKSVDIKIILTTNSLGCWMIYSKKIILTTAQDLIKDKVQAIDDEFLEWFVKNPSCEEVEVKKNYLVGYYYIIPKEEPKQFVKCKCTNALQTENCTRNCGHGENPKQETLEEAAKEYEEKDFITTTPTVENSQQMIQRAFTAGAKWQQERMYLDFISKAKI